MAAATLYQGQGKGLNEEEPEQNFQEGSSSSSDSDSDTDFLSDSDSSTTSSSESDEEVITQEYLDSLLEIARRNARKTNAKGKEKAIFEEEDIIRLEDEDKVQS